MFHCKCPMTLLRHWGSRKSTTAFKDFSEKGSSHSFLLRIEERILKQAHTSLFTWAACGTLKIRTRILSFSSPSEKRNPFIVRSHWLQLLLKRSFGMRWFCRGFYWLQLGITWNSASLHVLQAFRGLFKIPANIRAPSSMKRFSETNMIMSRWCTKFTITNQNGLVIWEWYKQGTFCVKLTVDRLDCIFQEETWRKEQCEETA